MRWNLKSPGNFPANWHSMLERGIGEYYLGFGRDEREARALADRFRHFRFCLRAFPGYAASAIERNFLVKLKTTKNEEGFFDVFVIIKERLDLTSVRSVLLGLGVVV